MERTPPPNRTWLQRFFISTTENRLRAGWRLLGQGLLLLFSVAVFGALGSFLLPYLADISFAGFLLLSTLIISLAVTLSIFIARRYLDRRSFTSLGLVGNRQAISDILFGFALTGLMIGLIYLVERLFGWLEVESYAWQMESFANLVVSILTMLLLFFAGSGKKNI